MLKRIGTISLTIIVLAIISFPLVNAVNEVNTLSNITVAEYSR